MKDTSLRTALIVDDSPDLIALLTAALPRHWPTARLTVLSAATLDEATAILGTSPIDLVVLDLLMPVGGGPTAVHQILPTMQAILGRLLPVVVISGYMSDIVEEQALRVGMQACVQKGGQHFPRRLAEAMRAAWSRHLYIEERLRLLREAGTHG